MIILDNQDQFHIPFDTAVTIGKFDGLHRGHQLLIEKAQDCRKKGLKACFFTFDFSDFFDTVRPSILTFDETVRFIEQHYEIDYLIRMPVTKAFFSLSYRTFLQENLLDHLHMKRIICGDDFCFGHNRMGTPDVLKELSKELGYSVDIVPRIHYRDDVISSTRIRKDLTEGKIEDANACLGYLYSIEGEVVHGKKLGSRFGFPTANIVPQPEKYLPCFGVYAVKVRIDGKVYPGLANIGVKPTVTDEKKAVLEVHLFNQKLDLYGKKMTVEFLSFIRPEQKFGSEKELIAQIAKDAVCVKRKLCF
ncbi:MAG: bifunctional riboflavin kinase/FAD synthetase [Lachnospiraceae bacterium]|nr:bifunctional riboflavin kinase/FAD synthetase [Lachnospiraceae bacterium]